ncbi:HAD family hydrolase [Sporanaerobium hydrogeniformans]|uniref:HAD family hydrolase n=1 Tax=Sporanaerobium hydrogeniformans TaxID=3072179 RepID=A0AC61DCB7_9FIRM|nr:HAD family hydrolase [Sporanaerobium hydrogeniformans]PHV70954.1 HAD family hydrolase [Sporanaerobium hydrogeniformans]
MKIDSLIFDLDGTLWDSVDGIVVAWNAAIKKFPEVQLELTRERVMAVMGTQLPEIARQFFKDVDEEKRQELMRICSKEECHYMKEHGGVLYDDLEETLSQLAKSYKLCIVSNCQCGYIESFLDYHKLRHYFIDIQDAESTGLTKAENIKKVIARNHLKAPVYIGDTLKDQESAKEAGIPFVYASYGFGEVKTYDYKINSFKELLKLFM